MVAKTDTRTAALPGGDIFCFLFDRQSNAKKKIRNRVLNIERVRDLPGQLLQRVPPRFITDALDLPGLRS